jgi:hypothetical protein
MAGAAADVEHGLADNRGTAFDRFLIPQTHAGPEIPIDETVQQGVAVAVNRGKVVRVRIEKLRCTIAGQVMRPPMLIYL